MEILELPLTGSFIRTDRPQMAVLKFKFPAGECHIKIGSNGVGNQTVVIKSRMNSSDDIMQVLLATNALKGMGYKNIDLYVPYIPYMRQDRVTEQGEPLSIKVLAELINLQGYRRVYTYDPHSDVGVALINDLEVTSNDAFVSYTLTHIPNKVIHIVSPDAGAQKKTYKLLSLLPSDRVSDSPVLCSKHRDTSTGELSGFGISLEENHSKEDFYLIVDDICDGGGTFCGIASKFKEKGYNNLGLAVSHGVFSKGTEHLKEFFNNYIFSTNSIQDEVDGVTIYKINYD